MICYDVASTTQQGDIECPLTLLDGSIIRLVALNVGTSKAVAIAEWDSFMVTLKCAGNCGCARVGLDYRYSL